VDSYERVAWRNHFYSDFGYNACGASTAASRHQSYFAPTTLLSAVATDGTTQRPPQRSAGVSKAGKSARHYTRAASHWRRAPRIWELGFLNFCSLRQIILRQLPVFMAPLPAPRHQRRHPVSSARCRSCCPPEARTGTSELASLLPSPPQPLSLRTPCQPTLSPHAPSGHRAPPAPAAPTPLARREATRPRADSTPRRPAGAPARAHAPAAQRSPQAPPRRKAPRCRAPSPPPAHGLFKELPPWGPSPFARPAALRSGAGRGGAVTGGNERGRGGVVGWPSRPLGCCPGLPGQRPGPSERQSGSR